jgi:hypothetical protein
MYHKDINTLLNAPRGGPAGAAAPGSSCSDVHSLAGSLICHPSGPSGFMSVVSFTLWRLLQAWWPLLTIAAVLALLIGAVLARAVRQARRDAAEQARWVEITPPASLPRDGAPAWWRALAGILHRTARHGITPRHLAVEFIADVHGVHAGVWVPPGLPVRRVAELVGHVWPGARARLTEPPRWTSAAGSDRPAGRLTAAEVYPAGGPWVPLTEPAARTARPVEVGTDDVLRGLFSALGDCEPGEQRCVQVIVSPEYAAPRTDSADRPWWVRLLAGGLRLLGWLLLGAVEVFLSKHSGGQSGHRAASAPNSAQQNEDPVTTAWRRAVTAKRAHGPHLRVTLRVIHHTGYPDTRTGYGPRHGQRRGQRRGQRGQHRRAVAGLAGGFDLAAPLTTLRLHRVGGGVGGGRRTRMLVDQRRPARRRHRFAATITELAGLWHLPAEPTRYGMDDAVGRVRRPYRDLPRRRPDTRRLHDSRTDRRRTDRRRRDNGGANGWGADRDAA